MEKKTNYFPGLDSLRAIAAFSVIIGHIELMKSMNGLPNLLHLQYFSVTSGHTGVVLFYVLSGFLITYLLLRERKKTQTISFRNFYLKRILRVWPLYFFIIILSCIIFQYTPSFLTLILCTTIFPNVAHALNSGWLVSPQLWSIGVEEQFYLVHPMLVRTFKKYIIHFLIIFFVLYTFLPQFLICYFEPSASVESFIRNFVYGSKYNCLALGGICAYLHLNDKCSNILKKIFKNNMIALIFLIVPFIMWILAIPIYLNDTVHICYTKIEVTQEVLALMFGLQILAVVNNSFIARLIAVRFLDYLGKISYGLYMFHWIALLLMIKLILPVFHYNYELGNVLMYVATITTTILFSALSFKYFESIFVRLRNKLTADKN